MDIYCPTCDKDFEAAMWEGGNCPICGREYWFEDYWNEETNEEWYGIEWGDEPT